MLPSFFFFPFFFFPFFFFLIYICVILRVEQCGRAKAENYSAGNQLLCLKDFCQHLTSRVTKCSHCRGLVFVICIHMSHTYSERHNRGLQQADLKCQCSGRRKALFPLTSLAEMLSALRCYCYFLVGLFLFPQCPHACHCLDLVQ